MNYQIDNQTYEVVIIKKNNKNTYIRVKPDMKIYVTTNYFTSKHFIKKLLDENIKDVKKMLNIQNQKQEKNNNFYYLGKKYDIIYVNTVNNLTILDNKIIVKNDKELTKWYQKQMKEIFKERLIYNYNLFKEDIPYPILKIRKMTTRWGVCNIKDNSITLNANLMRSEIDKLDYVIIHELSHFIHFNHSNEFWQLVSKYCPNYKKMRKELKDW